MSRALTPAQFAILIAELAAGHPVTGVYSLDDDEAARELNELNRAGAGNVYDLPNYLFLNEHRNGNLFGRIAMVAHAVPAAGVYGDLPLGAGGSAESISARNVAAAHAVIAIAANNRLSINLSDGAIDAIIQGLVGCGAIGPAHKVGIIALADNQQSRAMELGLPQIRGGTVQRARA